MKVKASAARSVVYPTETTKTATARAGTSRVPAGRFQAATARAAAVPLQQRGFSVRPLRKATTPAKALASDAAGSAMSGNETAKAEVGLVGLAVMGQNLALNVASKGFPISVYNRSYAKTE